MGKCAQAHAKGTSDEVSQSFTPASACHSYSWVDQGRVFCVFKFAEDTKTCARSMLVLRKTCQYKFNLSETPNTFQLQNEFFLGQHFAPCNSSSSDPRLLK